MYQEVRPGTGDLINIYADNVPVLEGAMISGSIPAKKHHFEVEKNDIFNSTLERPGMDKIIDPTQKNDVIGVVVLRPVIEAEEGKIDIAKVFDLVLENPNKPATEDALKPLFNSLEPDVLEVDAEGNMTPKVKLGQTFVNVDWLNGVLAQILVTIGMGESREEQPEPEVPVEPEGTKVSTVEELTAAIAAGEPIVLVDDITIPSPIQIRNSVVLNLNGHDIIAPKPEEGEGFDVIWVLTGGELVINGEGNVTGSYYGLYAGGNAKVTINGGNYFGIAAAIYAQSTAVVEVNGGTFMAENDSPEYDPQQFTLNIKDGSSAQILVKGGKYYKFDPANNKAEGENTNFVVEGYTSVQDGDYFIVS